MTTEGMNEEWAAKIADAVVNRLDEREQIQAIALEVIRILEANSKKSGSEIPSQEK